MLVVAVLVFGVETGCAQSRYFGESAAGDGNVVGGRMGGIPHRRESPAPTIEVDLAVLGIETAKPFGAEVMPIFPLGVDDAAEASGLVDPAHGVAAGMKAARLGHHILHAGLLDCLQKLFGIFDCGAL